MSVADNEQKLQTELALHEPTEDEQKQQTAAAGDPLSSSDNTKLTKSVSVHVNSNLLLNDVSMSDFNDHVDTTSLWRIISTTQCPLVPDRYDKDGSLCSIYYFNDAFWKQEDDGVAQDCRKVLLLADDADGSRHRKCKDDAELMLAVDRYTSNVSINTSLELYHKLKLALKEATTSFDDGDTSNDAYQKLMPTKLGRLMFVTVFITSTLNGAFIAQSMSVAAQGGYRTSTANVLALVMAISEAILFCNIFLVHILLNGLLLAYRGSKGQTTYIQTKTIALQLRNLSTLSILRYLPSVEIVSSAVVHWKETIAKIWSGMLLVVQNSLNNVSESAKCGPGTLKTVLDIVFSIPVYIIEVVAPFLAVYAILIKMQQLAFVADSEPFSDWDWSQVLSFIAFLNQVAGLRVLRNIETQSIQHFVFSGNDAELDTDELLLLNDWWNVTVLSAVSNLDFGWLDSMVFWYSLDPQKIQLLLKNQKIMSGGSAAECDSLMEMVKNNDQILTDYDDKVVQLLKKSSPNHE